MTSSANATVSAAAPNAASAGAPATPALSPAPVFIARVSGLAEETVAPLRSPAVAEWGARVRQLERELDALAGPVADALAAEVGRTDDPGRRRALLALRRDVHNRRMPKDPGTGPPLLGPDTPGESELARWVRLRRSVEDTLNEGATLIATEMERTRQTLWEVAEHEPFRRGLQVASPSLDQEVARHLASDNRGGKRARKAERSLLAYVLRAAFKPSPFSGLTTVALGRFDRDGGHGLAHHDGAGTTGTARFNVVAFAPIADAIVAAPELRRDLAIQVSPGCVPEGAKLRYLRREYLPFRSGENAWHSVAGYLNEKVVTMPRSALLDEVVATTRAHEPAALTAVAARIHAVDPDSRPLDQVEAYLGRLLELGVLTSPTLRVDPNHDDPFADLTARLGALDGDWATELAAHLGRVGEHAAALPGTSLTQRRANLTAARDSLVSASHTVGIDHPDPPRALVYEDVAHATTPRVDPAVWESDLAPALRDMVGVLPALDHLMHEQLVTRVYFRHRFGPGGTHDDVMSFAHEFTDDYFLDFLNSGGSTAALAAEAGDDRFRPPEFDAIRAARTELATRVGTARDRLPPEAPELVLDSDMLADVAAMLPAHLKTHGSLAAFLQHAPGSGAYVLNMLHAGWGAQTARFAHAFAADDAAALGTGLADHLASLSPDGTVFASLASGYDTSNLSLFPPMAPYELVCPGDVSFRPEAEQIPVEELRIVDDEEDGRLRLVCDRLGVIVVPVFSSALIAQSLPMVKRVLFGFSDCSGGFRRIWPQLVNSSPVGGLAHRPRVRLGNLVLDRRAWRAGPDGLPRRAEAASDVDWYLRWQRLAEEAGLPRRMFVRDDAGSVADRSNGRGGGTAHKPRYLDLDSPLTLASAEEFLSSGGRPELSEMLPDVGDLDWGSPEGRHASEVVVEFNVDRIS